MTVTVVKPKATEPIRSHDHANKALDDAPYLAYVLVQAMKLFIALINKRWPEVK
jgi:hypothetical protein